MPATLWDGRVVYTPEEWARRQYELDIDLKIIRAAKHGLPLTYTCYQQMRELVLGQKLNIRCQYQPESKNLEAEISQLR